MPRKTKEQTKKDNSEIKKVTTTKKTTAKKATSSSKRATTKKVSTTTKKTTNQKSTAKKSATTSKKITATSSNKKTPKKSAKSNKSKSLAKVKALPIVEYYDLPYRYNQTVVKLLAQTPTNLFVYWDISDEDRENYKKTYGENFFEETRPVLIIHNITMNYSFEVEINDFANSWYIHVNDSKCNYHIDLGRRPIPSINNNIHVDYIYISSSNNIESPNDKILFNIDEHKVYYRNVKTNITSTKSISLIKSMGKIYNIYDLYKTIYKEEVQDNMIEDLPSSIFK